MDPKKAEQLKARIRRDFPNLNDKVSIFNLDGNQLVRQVSGRDWRGKRALVFLDPFGTQVEWSTMQLLAQTRAVDLWTLVPVGALNRMLCNDGVRPEFRERLRRYFGTPTWESELYKVREKRQGGLFEEYTDSATLKVSHSEVGEYYLKRLAEIFPHVCSRPLILRNSNDSPLFLLCFATANPNAQVAVKIAGEILKKKQR